MKFYTLDEVAEILKLRRETLYKYIRIEKLKAAKFGKSFRIEETDLQEFVQRAKEKNKNIKKLEVVQPKLVSEPLGHSNISFTSTTVLPQQYRRKPH